MSSASASPIVILGAVPATSKALPSKVKFASPFRPPEPSPVTILLFASFDKDAPAEPHDKVPEPFVKRALPLLPSAVGNVYVISPDCVPTCNAV